GISMPHFYKFQPAHVSQQLPWLRFDMAFAQPRTGVVINRTAFHFSAKVILFQYIHKKIRQLMDVSLDSPAPVMHHCIRKQIIVCISDHPGTGCRRRYDDAVVGEVIQKFSADFFGFVPKTGVVSRLTTAGLLWVVHHLTTCMFEYLYSIEGSFGKQLVDKTRNKQFNGHEAVAFLTSTS